MKNYEVSSHTLSNENNRPIARFVEEAGNDHKRARGVADRGPPPLLFPLHQSTNQTHYQATDDLRDRPIWFTLQVRPMDLRAGALSQSTTCWFRRAYVCVTTAIFFLLTLSIATAEPKRLLLEPISKSPEEDNEASDLYEAEEVVGVVFPTDEDAALPLNPSKEALHEPTSHIAA